MPMRHSVVLVRRELRPSRSEEHTLNSSHTVISYAVFCLKKKIQLIESQTNPAKKEQGVGRAWTGTAAPLGVHMGARDTQATRTNLTTGVTFVADANSNDGQ